MSWSMHQFSIVVVDGVFLGFLFILLPFGRSQGQGHLDGNKSSKKDDPLAVHCWSVLIRRFFRTENVAKCVLIYSTIK